MYSLLFNYTPIRPHPSLLLISDPPPLLVTRNHIRLRNFMMMQLPPNLVLRLLQSIRNLRNTSLNIPAQTTDPQQETTLISGLNSKLDEKVFGLDSKLDAILKALSKANNFGPTMAEREA
ncbi:unnamed protein product [Lactuca virosa]|uniref:Uncharacterized protein n=1 Tax=Lactuca virosa TaxID=75947 RepID=A0AAU9P9R3_9ASTR|nr:unnamed protein product [Lactuca virosa]